MNHSRHDFLADAAFAADKNRDIHGSDLQDLLANTHHLGAGGQEAKECSAIVAKGHDAECSEVCGSAQ